MVLEIKVYISGSPEDLALIEQATSGTVLGIQRDPRGYYLGFHETEVLERAREMLEDATALGRAHRPDFFGLNTTGTIVVDSSELEIPTTSVTVGGTYTVRPPAVAVTPDPTVTARVLAAQATNPAYARAWRLAGKQPLDLASMYDIYEILRQEAGGQKKFRDRLNLTDGELSAFTAPANKARHATTSRMPDTVLTPQECRDFILDILKRWPLT